MNSSIFNSRRGEALTNIKSLAAVLLLLGAAELTIRIFEARLSLDVAHIRSIPSILAGIAKQSRPRIVLLGNSLTHASIQPQALTAAWSIADSPKPNIARVYPDDTTLLDWHYIYLRHLKETRERPDLIVVGFALSQLNDHQEIHIDKLGGYFAGLPLITEAFEHDLLNLDQRAQFLLSATFGMLANRERVQSRVLANIPGYKALANAINQGARAARHPVTVEGIPRFERLRRFISAARAAGDNLLFVAIPLPHPYPVSDELRTVIRESGMELIDMQGVESLAPFDFPDGYHLSRSAAERFSRALSGAMASNSYVQSVLTR